MSKSPRKRPVKSSRRTGKKRAVPAGRRHGWALVRLWLVYLAGTLCVLAALWVVYLDVLVREKFDGRKWTLPARVYAQPLELYESLTLTPALFERELEALGYRWVASAGEPGQVSRRQRGGRMDYNVYTRGFAFWDGRDPARQFRVSLQGDRVVQLAGPDGEPMPLVRLEPEQIGGIYPTQAEDRLLVQLRDLPPLLGETLIAVEDRDFLDHMGISITGIARAAWVNLRSGEVVQGGSTLTQQLVKNFYLSHERSFTRKAQEAVMSILLELHYSKSEILETYVNEVFLGQSGGRAIHGFALASHHYFQRPLGELDTPRIALLVGLVKGASFYNPWRNPERARARRDLVLGVMHTSGLIDGAEYERALGAPLGVVAPGQRARTTYPAFIDLVKRQLARDYREEDLQTEGLRIFTTLSPMVQRQAEAVLSQRIGKLERQHDIEGLEGALVVTSVGAGEVLALVGGRQPRFAGFNRALDARRPVGSLIKPFVYLTALEQPERYHLGTLISDEPVSVGSDDGQLWQPRNADRQSHGQVPLIEALAHSYNQATVRLGMQVGLAQVARTIERAGFDGTIPQVPAITLGSIAMSPYQVATSYHTLASEGSYTPLRAIREVLTAEGEPLNRYPLVLQQRFSAGSSYALQYALQTVLREGTGSRVYSQFPESLPLAGKTGTTDDQRDSWFAGFSGQHLAVAWLGRDDNTATPLTGSAGALQVWADFMQALPTLGVNLQPPEGVSFDWVDSRSGKLSAEGCENAIWLPLPEGHGPRESSRCYLQQQRRERSWWYRFWH